MRKIGKVLTILTVTLFLAFTVLYQPVTIKAQQTSQAPNLEFQKEYSNALADDNRTVSLSNLYQTSDGGYVFLDLGWIHSVTLQPATLYKIGASGDLQWQKTIRNFLGKSLVYTSDGGYELSGRWSSPPLADQVYQVATIIKTYSNGDIAWVQNYTSYQPPSTANVSTCIQTSDGGFAYVDSGSLVKIDSSNQTQWTLAFTLNNSRWYGEGHPVLFSLTETSDGAIAVLGVDNPAYGTNVWGSIYLAKTEPFLPEPSATALPTPIPTPITISDFALTLTFLAVIVIVASALVLLLYRRHRRAADKK